MYISDDDYEAMKINEKTTSARVLRELSNAKAGDRIRTAGGKIVCSKECIVLFDFNVGMANQQLSLDETVCGKGTNLFLTPASEIQVHAYMHVNT